jgi:hypothetical protein
MASELRVNTLKDAAGNNSIATSFVANGSAKAWASFDQGATGHPVYTDASLNTASTTDVDDGVTKLAFTNSFNNADYGISGVCQVQDAGGTVFGTWGKSTTSSRQMTTSNFHTENRVSSATPRDSDYTAYKVLGDLA